MGKHWQTYRSYLSIGILFMLASCHSTNKDIVAALRLSTDDSILDPSQLWLTDRYIVMDNISIKLVHINSKNDYELILAERLDMSPDGRSVKIKIRSAFFSDGSPITSNDVERSFKRLILRGSAHIPIKDIVEGGSNLKKIEDNISGLNVISNNEIEIRLNKSVKEFVYYLTLADASILHNSLIEKETIHIEDWKVVSGAYLLDGDVLRSNPRAANYSDLMPRSVKLKSAPLTGTREDVKNFDIGFSGFINKAENENASLPSPYKYTSNSYDLLVYLILNPRSNIFKNQEVRRGIAKKISEKFFIDEKMQFFKKANQFFLPDSFAFQKSFDVSRILDKSKHTKKGLPSFKILATVGTKKYTFDGLSNELSNAIGSDVSISFTDDLNDYKSRKIKRDFDAYLVPTSMSYNVVSESLNLLYRSDIRFGENPNGKIIKLIDDYQSSIGTAPELIEKIATEMTEEAEIIPLFNLSSPDFYNSDRIDISEMNISESLTFWKLRVK